ncbi:MAG: hypothetical protein Q8Q33_09580, partial [Chlamydiota bacterium]|nr:hypothetical protein [Chlamydiota bacterium]
MNTFTRIYTTILIILTAINVWPQEKQNIEENPFSSRNSLPLKKVVLYTSGVGYFQHHGIVEDDAQIELRMKSDDINDILKSMVVQDFDGGLISNVTYDSRDPITKTLQSFAVDLTSNPNLRQLLDQIRGESITVTAPQPITGIILGTEVKDELLDEHKLIKVEYINLLTPDGIRSISFNSIQKIQLSNKALNQEIEQALSVLASGHDTQKKLVNVFFSGKGKRHVRISYIQETPVWKTTYRLVLSDKSAPYLQGWAIIENTTDEDWQNIDLILISGRPISFIMDMYEPLYIQRPIIVPTLYESLQPQLYDQAMETKGEGRSVFQAFALKESAEEEAYPRKRAYAPSPVQDLDLERGIESLAQGDVTGELFAYTLQTPVSLPRQKSALLPILN